jgi:negative regulator of sigma E activity
MRRFLAAAVIVVAVVGTAYAQGKKGAGSNTQLPQMEEQQKKQSKEVDRAYNDTIKRTQKDAKPYDPWGSVRPPPPPAGKN